MRTPTRLPWLSLSAAATLALCLASGGPPAWAGGRRAGKGGSSAEVKLAGSYAVTFEDVSNNCSGVGMNLGSATVQVSQPKSHTVQVTIPAVPIMSGTVSKGGKFRAVARRGKTAIQGVDGRFSVAGRVDAKGLQFLFIAEYYQGKKPLCTQSWNARGPRK